MDFTYTSLFCIKKRIVVATLLLITTLSLPVQAQQMRTVSGIVKGEQGPLPGASVIIKGTSQGTATNAEGKYTIKAESGSVLVISSVGFQSIELTVDKDGVMDVDLSSAVNLTDEVVVVGYGTQTRRNVTGAVSKVNLKETESLPNTNVTQALRGRVAGVQFTDNGHPGQNGSILVRGPRSLSANNDPLIILDGAFFNGSLIDINNNDIASMEILKDASAAAIYGSRAANGVILITSKKGTSEKPTIGFNTFYGLSDWASKMKLLSPERYLEKSMEIRRLRNSPFDANDPSTYLTISEAENYRKGITIDPYDMVAQQGRIFSADVNIARRTDQTNYYMSASRADENGLVYNDNLKRTSIRFNLESKITDWLTIGTRTMFSENDQSGIPANLSQVSRQSPFGTWYREDGTPTQFTVPEDQGASPNPLRDAYLMSNEFVRNNLNANFYAEVKIPGIKGLSYKLNYTNNYRWIREYITTRQDPYLNTNNTSASKRNFRANDWVVENILDYSLKIGEQHQFDVTLLYGNNKDYQETTTATSGQLEFDIFGWNRLNVGAVQTNSSSAQNVSGVSSMARLNYRFMDRYLLTVTARRDGSSVFAANNKYATLPSAAVSWIASDEKFLQNVSLINFLKLRASYGAVGNQAISPYQSLSRAAITRYPFGSESALGIYPSNISNEELKWETTYTGNLALDFQVLNHRIGGTVELYNMNTRDLLVERSIPIMTGYSSIWTNLGKVNNSGIELTLNTVNLKSKNFEWSTDFVFSHNKNKIVSLYGTDANGDGKEDDDIANRWFIGKPINSYYDYVFDGIYQEGQELPAGYQVGFARFKDLNGDGKVEATNDRTIIGQGSQPDYRWGITNNFSYRNFSLSVFVNAMQGWIATFNDLDFMNNTLDPLRPVNMYDGGWWTPENKSDTRPSLEYRRSVLGHNWYASRNFIRIQDVSLSYNFPTSFLEKHKVSRLNVFISGKNLATFTDWPGSNPESISDDQYPIARSVAVGFKLEF